MDKQTIDTYNREAASIAQLHVTLTPQRIYALIDHYFIKNGTTLDVGCGIGRDTHWLTQQGFPATGVDASEQMLQQAQALYPTEHFFQDALPELNHLGKSQFQNILCSAVLMHLNPLALNTACLRLLQLLNDSGCLIISFRGTHETDNREKGKLYETINMTDFLKFFAENQCTILVQESETEASRNLTWHNFVIKK
ncbi:class I SAM-dependent methyltransferase [Methylobacter psychrophilus]|uniref:class I SAM-dependent methyltransferase n=1 Tax=Methylobacter psychrophilus TaxID=96941 RepID=UPI0021D4F500|nr:class I SAM-dependent methyltransferase [Methylobacter psychrophilus]